MYRELTPVFRLIPVGPESPTITTTCDSQSAHGFGVHRPRLCHLPPLTKSLVSSFTSLHLCCTRTSQRLSLAMGPASSWLLPSGYER